MKRDATEMIKQCKLLTGRWIKGIVDLHKGVHVHPIFLRYHFIKRIDFNDYWVEVDCEIDQNHCVLSKYLR